MVLNAPLSHVLTHDRGKLERVLVLIGKLTLGAASDQLSKLRSLELPIRRLMRENKFLEAERVRLLMRVFCVELDIRWRCVHRPGA